MIYASTPQNNEGIVHHRIDLTIVSMEILFPSNKNLFKVTYHELRLSMIIHTNFVIIDHWLVFCELFHLHHNRASFF